MTKTQKAKPRKHMAALAALMLVTAMMMACPVQAYAADGEVELNGTTYSLLEDALAVAVSGDTITLLGSIGEPDLEIDVYSAGHPDGLTIDMNSFNMAVYGVYVSDGYSLSITGGGTLSVADDTIAGGNGSTLNVTAEEFFSYSGVYVVDGATANITGDLYSVDTGVWARGTGTKVNINGSVIVEATDDNSDYDYGTPVDGVFADDHAVVYIDGDVTVTGQYANDGVQTWGDGVSVTVTGNVTSAKTGVITFSNYSTVTVGGNVTGESVFGAYVVGEGNIVTIGGDIKAERDGIYLGGDSTVHVHGDICTVYTCITGMGWGGSATVDGDVCSENLGIHVDGNNFTIEVKGSVNATAGVTIFNNSDSGISTVKVGGSIITKSRGIRAIYNSVVSVGGNVEVSAPENPDESIAVEIRNQAQVTVDGKIIAGDGVVYIQFTEHIIDGDPIITRKTSDQVTVPTTRQGYYTYTNGVGTVWVYSGSPDYGANTGTGAGTGAKPTTPPTGDITGVLASLVALQFAVFAVCAFISARKMRQAIR